ncbi:hypothetical protein IEQ34_024700 [Dendrobium chrysotoxum]|uniref:Transmembrane protein n=1 Tax=Dendrobium chrysotoxum TaxID=161865 RepID=A0AAV7FSZ7_DENCH|nr:hypothetical protein IEQ34_024700 [Dendrobium chrysotoxum]
MYRTANPGMTVRPRLGLGSGEQHRTFLSQRFLWLSSRASICFNLLASSLPFLLLQSRTFFLCYAPFFTVLPELASRCFFPALPVLLNEVNEILFTTCLIFERDASRLSTESM